MGSAFVHPSSVVDEPCTLGEGTQIWHYCHVSRGAVLGRGCTLGQNVFVGEGVVLGNGVKVQNNVSIYAGVQVEDDVFLGPSCVFTNVTHPRAAVSRRHRYEATRVRRGVTVGANATILCGVEIGAYAFVGAGAVVRRDVAPYALVYGVPARPRGWVGEHGVPLRFDAEGMAVCPESGQRYLLSPSGVRRLDSKGEPVP
jgi:UDP-2-acetamido-3-amino-2,3-dideoxy-glucuronate N-acetyltransferase